MWSFAFSLFFSLSRSSGQAQATTLYTGTLTVAQADSEDHAVSSFSLRLVHSSGRTQTDFRRLKISSLVYATGAIF